jgi:hypothetical protein
MSVLELPVVTDQLKEAADFLVTGGVTPEGVASVLRSPKDRDGVLLVRVTHGKVSGAEFHPVGTIFNPHRTPEELLADADFKRKRGKKFIVKNGVRAHLADLAKYEARVLENGEWDSGNLATWMPAVLEKLVAAGKLTKRPGRDDELTANGRPTIYEPTAESP